MIFTRALKTWKTSWISVWILQTKWKRVMCTSLLVCVSMMKTKKVEMGKNFKTVQN